MIRIYGFKAEACRQLWDVCEQLSLGVLEEASLTDLPGVEPLGGCSLVAQAGGYDKGIIREGGNVFYRVLTPVTWDKVAGLIEPFCTPGKEGYQWLDKNTAGEARVLISTSGSW